MVGTLFNKGVSFLTVPIFTRILSTYDYGIVNTYNSWIAIVAMIVGLAMHMGIRSAFVDYNEKTDEIISVTSTFVLIYGIVLCPIAIAITVLFHIKIAIFLVALCVVQSMAVAILENYTMMLMMKLEYKFRTALMVLPNLVSVIFSIMMITLVLESDYYLGRIIPTAIISILFGLWILYKIYKKSRTLFHKGYLKYVLTISFPLVFHGIALNILSQSDRTMITMITGASDAGIYSVIYNLGMISLVFTAALDGIWVPWFIDRMKEKEYLNINSKSKDYIDLMSYMMVCLILVGPEIVKLLAAKDYWKGISIIPPIVLSNFVVYLYTLFVNIEHYYKKTPYITLNTIVAAVVNILLNLWLIPIFGYGAAAYTTLISYIVAFGLHLKYAKKLQAELFPFSFFVVPFIYIVLSVILFYFFQNVIVVRWLYILIFMAIMLYRNRKRIALYFPNLKLRFRK
jgi:O-antigen/teichoic acid export membrane protein